MCERLAIDGILKTWLGTMVGSRELVSNRSQ